MNLEQLSTILKKEGTYKAFTASGLPCRMMRHSAFNLDWHMPEQPDAFRIFHWCGYVGVTKDHPCYGMDYSSDYSSSEEISIARKKLNNINVHGGLTYSTDYLHFQPEKDLWWFGFDCAHAGDLSMITNSINFEERWAVTRETYKDKEYVEKEVRSLARQLSKIK